MIPQSVLDAGREERERLWLNSHVEPNRVQDGRGESPAANPVLFEGSYGECRDFIEERVFRAMLRALADEYGRVGAVATETQLFEILGDDHG